MDSEYDRKFEEMKKYIPFLESMIKRLESTSSMAANPRQAQLDKIRSLRDLLLDKKKRMKMENLLKCEQVLVNLYAKVEQRDCLPTVKKPSEQYSSDPPKSKEKANLQSVRNKLKSVTNQEHEVETLPEIARASEIEEVCTPGSKEPALFQRRPNKPSKSPTLSSPVNTHENKVKSPQKTAAKRNYTRVLVSPEPNRRWTTVEDSTAEKPRFSRRSPRRSPRRHSPTHHKKERNKSSKQGSQSRQPKDLNITLNVPEESLNSLNTKDILSRIINCSDSDVDISTLRELRTQILGELKQTGANDDISDLILKSYKNKKSVFKQKKEVEEGELSDSESEAIESIYGSLVVVEKDNNISGQESSFEKEDQPRKIQICLVINSKDSDLIQEESVKQNQKTVDITEFEMYNGMNEKTKKNEIPVKNKNSESNIKENLPTAQKQSRIQEIITIDDDDDKFINISNDESPNINNENKELNLSNDKVEEKGSKENDSEEIDHKHENNKSNDDLNKPAIDKVSQDSSQQNNGNTTEPVPFKANFYKPLIEEESADANSSHIESSKPLENLSENKAVSSPSQLNKNDDTFNSATPTKVGDDRENSSKDSVVVEKLVEIPLLNEPTIAKRPSEKDVFSEIDILQALKNEILSENIPIPGTEIVIPPLHQPKLIKVASAREIMPKKRISIEKYKERSVPSSTTSLFVKERRISTSKEDLNKKQSLKLTEKECERFNFPVKIALHDNVSSDDEGKDEPNEIIDDIYGDLAPRSPDNEDSNEIETTPPVIIPVDPVKTTKVNLKADIDMRTVLPMVSPNMNIPALNNDKQSDVHNNDAKHDSNKNAVEKNKVTLVDPRVRRDLSQPVNKNSPNPHAINPERTPRSVSYSNVTPNILPNMTPSMTPNARTYDMTPTHQSFDLDDHHSKSKHVYVPAFSLFESRDIREQSITKEARPWDNETKPGGRKSRWDESKERNPRKWEDSDSRSNSSQREIIPQKLTYSDPYKYDKYSKGPKMDTYKIDRRSEYSRTDCPQTPVPSFGWSDCPSTPNAFGRLEGPMTPIHNFGRSDCPLTPSHSFGRSECPPTPSNPFSRSDCPLTPSNPFTRNDGSMTPGHSFGRIEFAQNNSNNQMFTKDPRLNRPSEYELSPRYDERERDFFRDGSFNHGSSYKAHNRPYNSSDSYRNYDREQSMGRSDRTKYYPNEQAGRYLNKESISRREPSIGPAISRDRESERLYSRERGGRHEYNDRNFEECGARRGFQRERSIGRSVPQENFTRSTSRALSVGRTNRKESVTENKLSVKSHAGRSFTIDTSVNSTFQDLIERKGLQIFDYTFDAHRKRAVSVGRSLCRESSVGRTLPQANKRPNTSARSDHDYKNHNFRRASSMGRDMSNSKVERSFQEVKADFESYKNKINLKVKNVDSSCHKKHCEKSQTSKSNNVPEFNKSGRKFAYKSPRERKSGRSDVKQTYSPRKNYRDPRMRRQQQYEVKNKYDISAKDPRDRKNYGIVYSSDNIAKGTILGPGYGVKNYKIPKIKRITEDKEEKDKDINDTLKYEDKKVDTKLETNIIKEQEIKSNDKNKKKKQNYERTVNEVAENPGKRLTRSSKKSVSVESKPNDDIVITRKAKKPITYDSDSDNESINNKEELGNKITSSYDENSTRIESPSKEINEQDKEDLNSSFGLDDYGIFSDNIVSDPVIDNINALIADLDNDIDTSKNDENGDFTDEISLENMLDSITSTNNLKNLENESLDDIAEVIKDELDNSDDKQSQNMTQSKVTEEITDKSNATYPKPVEKLQLNADISCNEMLGVSQESKDIQAHSEIEKKEIRKSPVQPKILGDNKNDKLIVSDQLSDNDVCNINNEAIVSTTNKDIPEIVDERFKLTLDNRSNNSCSTPDSTINTNEVVLEISKGLPDSTNELQTEMNSDVTSTHNSAEVSTKDIAETSSSRKEVASTIDSIGSLLSILQDKSKIKELLSMLGDQSSENDKIKKKLEKLREIVSDDEDTNNVLERKEATEKSNKEESSIMVESQPIDALETLVEPELEKNEGNKVKQIESLEEKETVMYDDSKNTVDNKNDEMAKSEDLDKSDNEENTEQVLEINEPKKKGPNKKSKKRRFSKIHKDKRITRAGATGTQVVKAAMSKKPSRELMKLQEDIKEMFLSDEILNATGIRMCRLAKLVDDKNSTPKENTLPQEPKPVVVLEKFKDAEKLEETITEKPARKKPGPKPKNKATSKDSLVADVTKVDKSKVISKYKPGPKSKTKITQKQEDIDPYNFESDSVDHTILKESEEESENSSESESDSLGSSKSFGSNEVLADIKKKPKRKRRGNGWQTGVIKPKHKKKKIEVKPTELALDDELPIPQRDIVIPDLGCFTDKLYCFQKNIIVYSCRLCDYNGKDIVHHYKKQHPHTEIPLSRMNPATAREAIEQCKEINFQAISKIPTERYVCRFCFKEFAKTKAVLEAFFWHVVSTHTGEYKQICSECINITRCPFNLDIPPPPKDIKGQLIGYICKKCNFTQISLENLKTHVIVRHNDEQTEVYTINLAAMSRKILKSLTRRCNTATEVPRVLRSLRSNQSVTEASDDRSDLTDNSSHVSEIESVQQSKEYEETTPSPQMSPRVPFIKSKITFEADDNASEISNVTNTEQIDKVKIEHENEDQPTHFDDMESETPEDNETNNLACEEEAELPNAIPSDIMACAHFKINYKESGTKEYICCINGKDHHYKTTLLISMKKHVQMKHTEIWDGYCIVCKVIVTPQGMHYFKDCLQHFLDKHMDDFPVLDKVAEESNDSNIPDVTVLRPEETSSPKPYINVRPLAQLISTSVETSLQTENSVPFPKIESVVSLGSPTVEPSRSSPNYPITVRKESIVEKPFKYEEWQAEVMSKKHRVVLETMMSRNKLIKVYKCAGRFCSFTSDNAEDALLHASTHQRIGGENALNCAYCDFDTSRNAIDLVMHVFKTHGRCQYSCALCFYRAAASQLVGAHITRVHDDETSAIGSVLRATTISTPVAEDSANLLTREEAVPYYVCGHITNEGDLEGTCKFRTYIHEKFSEHLQQRHHSPHPCSICSTDASNPTELIQHMKTHGLKLYQCTWCVHGAENEIELMSHASAKHPSKQPQAYLRIITNKGGSSELRVLPLAYLNKSKLPTEDVTPGSSDDAVREAERSIELEKLIGHIESAASFEPVETVENRTNSDTQNTRDGAPLFEYEAQDAIENSLESCPSLSGNASPATAPYQDNSRQITPVIKTESPENANNTSSSRDVIYCLDSDEEDSRQNVIDLSVDDSATSTTSHPPIVENTKYVRVPMVHLYKCPKCKAIFRNLGGFKKHMSSCCPNIETRKVHCPHNLCTEVVDDNNALVQHYLKDHREEVRDEIVNIYTCGVCDMKSRYLKVVKKHIKEVHKMTKVVVSSYVGDKGNTIYTVRESDKGPPKRKLSAEQGMSRRYGPQDIDQLPINPILDNLVYCSLCEFNTKVRLNMVRHLQLHAEQQPVPKTAPINPVPHLESNEKHFDKMVNLASSSVVTRGPDKTTRPETRPTVRLVIPPEVASRYPKYVPERQRYTCGAKGCSYISLDEAMLRCHWDTLHSNSNDFHCVHCPPYQNLDTTRPLSAIRIIGHLKMHDTTLYACSSCSYYHFKREVVEKHLTDVHKSGQLMVVREELSASAPSTVQPTAAPTMDLKPWQCGLCKFKSMLRPEVVEHCAKLHQSKMQYKCGYCPFRTSAIENVTKHQANSHPGKIGDVFYYYYREGSIADEADGTSKWMKQRQKSGATESEVKTEVPDATISDLPPLTHITPAVSSVTVDLNKVKQEVNVETSLNIEESIEDLCKRFGQFCEPNGIKYKCSLCKVVVEDTRENMQSHLYEELKYRKWGCGLCSYKAFHRAGLNGHMTSEHRRQYQEPIELATDVNIEKWVAKHLDHQAAIIDKNKENLNQQKLIVAKVTAGPSKVQNAEKSSQPDGGQKYSASDLEQAFGDFGASSNLQYCCPKCKYIVKDEATMRQHLESELSKIRWCCSNCTSHFQTYHEAQFHCKSSHAGQSARPLEAARDPGMRSQWVTSVIQAQKKTIDASVSEHTTPENVTDMDTDPNENSLLVVRYEEDVETVSRKRPAHDSDEERLVIDEAETVKRKIKGKACPYCDYKSKWSNVLKDHLLRHYNLKPYVCVYCRFNGYRGAVVTHIEKTHPGQPCRMESMPVPDQPPQMYELPTQRTRRSIPQEDGNKVICLECEKYVHENDVDSHRHDNVDTAPEFAVRGEVVVKCCICLKLRMDVKSLQEHHNYCHPDIPINYAFFKLHCDSRESHYCGHCQNRFRFLRDLKSHHNAVHGTLPFKYTTTSGVPTAVEDSPASSKRKNDDDSVLPAKKVAKKSTTKLPQSQAVAKKSTTKLPVHCVGSDSESDTESGYTYYGTKPPRMGEYANVTTLMPFCNTLRPFTVKTLSEIIKIDPKVVVKDMEK